jgi:hypothetical protein
VVAVVAELASGLTQWGSGFLVTGDRVLTAWHCTVDKESGVMPVSLSVFRKADGAGAVVGRVVSSRALDVAVLELGAHPWAGEWESLKYGRVDRSRAGMLEDCQAIGYPLFQADPADMQRNTAELHGDIRRTDEAESGFLLLRDRDLETVSSPDEALADGGSNPWGGLSGALVFHQGYALGIVVEHHPRQGKAAVRILPVDRIAADTAPDERSVAVALGLPGLAELPLLTGEPLDPMAEFLSVGSSASPLDALAGDPGAPGWNVTSRFLDAAMRGPGGELPFAGRDAELTALDEWLASPASAYHLVTGNAGTGKSTLLARWSARQVQNGTGLRVVLVPVSARYEANSGLDVFRALLHRLAKVHGVSYDRSGGLKEYREEVAGLLARPAPDGLALLIVLDGLDEASDWEPGPQYFPARLGSRVRVLLSARQTGQRPTARAWLEALELDPGKTATTELSALGPGALVSLVEQVRGTGAPGNAELAGRLLQVTGGEPVVTALYLRDLAETPDADPGAWPGESSSAGRGINGYLDRWLREQHGLWRARDARRVKRALRVLNLLALAEAPIERAHLRLLAGRAGLHMDGEEVSHALELLDRFILPGIEHATVVLAHPLIEQARRDWLRDTGEYDEYARAYAGWADEVLASVVDGSAAAADVPRYLIGQAAQHLLPAGADGGITLAVPMAAAYRLLSPKWRRAQEAFSNDLLGYRQGVARVAACVRSANAAAVAVGQVPPYLPEQVGCATALATERLALSADLTPELAGQLVRHGLWRPGRALSYLAGIPTMPASLITGTAPYLDRADLPALREILDGFSAPDYHRAAWGENARATAVYARRVLELAGPQAAMEAATWVPASNPDRGKITVWVLAELIPLLPAPLARHALADALRIVQQERRDVSLSAAHLTRHVPIALASELWHEEDYDFPPDRRGIKPRYAGPAELLISCVTSYGKDTQERFIAPSGSAQDHVWDFGRDLVTTGPWLDAETFNTAFGQMMGAIGTGTVGSLAMEEVLPAYPDQGLMSIVPAGSAEQVADYLAQKLDGKNRTTFLLQLLPLLPGEARERFAEQAFEHPELLPADLDDGTILVVGPAVGQAGYAGRILDAAAARLIKDPYIWIRALAPYLTREEARRALSLSRRLALARLASFGPADAARALDTLYADAEWMPAGLAAEMTRCLDGFTHADHSEPDPGAPWGTSGYGTPWWEAGRYLGVPWERDSGLRAYRRPPRTGSGEAASTPGTPFRELVRPSLTDAEAVAVAFDAVGTLTAGDSPGLSALAASREDPWAALTVLAAGTHLPDPSSRAQVTDAITARLGSLRDAVLADGPARHTHRYGLPDDCPWLMLGDGDWTPFFARMLHPSARLAVKPVLFGDGYLDGVERTHSWYMEQEHQRLDDWAHDILALTVLLDVPELDHVARVGDPPANSGADSPQMLPKGSPVRSATTRGWFWAGLAVGYSACGAWDSAAASLRKIGGADRERACEAALTEMGATSATADLVTWLAQVHAYLSADDRTEMLRRVLTNRWAELTDEQCWAVIDQWLTDVSHGSPLDVLSDSLGYADGLSRLAGPDELRRFLRLILPQGS